jgi:hypothetical protein
MVTFGDLKKPSRTARKRATLDARTKRRTSEDKEKGKVRRRDKRCRFPLCGCRLLKLRLEVSHQVHKGMGGNPDGDRSTADQMIYLCDHRHQFGAVSRHKGTLRAEPLTKHGTNGPVEWRVDPLTIAQGKREPWSGEEVDRVARALRAKDWLVVAREAAVQQLEPLEPWQRRILQQLAAMEM